DDAPGYLVRPDDSVDHRDERGNDRTLRLEVAMTPAPVDLRIERKESVFVEVARHRDGIELSPGMRVNKRRRQMEKAEAGPERQDEEEGYAVAVGCRPLGDQRTDSMFKSSSLDVFSPCNDGTC